MAHSFTPLELAALAFVDARDAKAAAKTRRNKFNCPGYLPGDFESPEIGPCWTDQTQPQCEECKKRNAAHFEIGQAQYKCARTLAALRREVNKLRALK